MNDEEAALLMAALAAVESDIETEGDSSECSPSSLFEVPLEKEANLEPIHVPFPLEPNTSTEFLGDDIIFYQNLDLIFPPATPNPTQAMLAEVHQVYEVKLTTTFLERYWKNGRKNLQCFPFCPEYNDFYAMKIQDKKHASVGVCRTPVHCVVRTPINSPLLYVLGRFDQISSGRSPSPPPAFSTSNAGGFEVFRRDCFEAKEVETKKCAVHDANMSTWMFLPDVWKIQPLLRKKRKATRTGPAQTFPFYFRVFVYILSCEGYQCVAVGQSTPFQLFSTRTVDRLKKTFKV
ncbi:hypothetical protein THRCLA_01045 [Thraustotheca clavata]|uniref:Uncharacterized protein n=1 Tax=Thraustotheca clavata TaxID=74557 RepID=A0A1W0A9H4_9STRA|nr:hypothetical protein THRCLA_01045 [Thraustotheca clavata]